MLHLQLLICKRKPHGTSFSVNATRCYKCQAQNSECTHNEESIENCGNNEPCFEISSSKSASQKMYTYV